MSKNKNVPHLRFKEFTDEWELKKLGELCKMRAGRFINATEIIDEPDSELYPCYGGNGIRGYTKSFNQDGKFSLIGRQGAHCGNVALADGKFYATEHAVVVFLNQGLSTDWIYYLLRNLNLNQYSTGLAQPGLSVQNLEKVEAIISPLLPEQIKIASFLTSIEKRINELKQKKTLLEQYKKGVIQKFLSQELRFKDENGKDFPNWEKMKLGEVVNYEQPTKYLVSSTEYDDKFKTPVLTAGKTFILGYTNEEHGIYEAPLPVIIFDDFTTATQFVDFPFKAKSSAMKILFPNDGFDIKFIYESMKLMKYEIGGHERHWISKFASIEMNLPSYKEQTKVSSFLSAIDEKINRTDNQIQQTQTYKKGLLQNMFV